EPDSTLDLSKVAAKIKADDIHFARTRLLCLENTQNGRALPLAYLEQAAEFVKAKNLRLHLDGARLFNAAVKQKVAAREITKHFDSASVCLSKGLGAPVGSVLCGSRDFIEEARKWRKMCGGGMRQSGIVAAGALYALENNIERLAIDHQHAEELSNGLRRIPGLAVESSDAQTNMVFIALDGESAQELAGFLQKKHILINAGATTRLVTHLDISDRDIVYTLEQISRFFDRRRS
ncbi:MAG: GntG family PLP-dependent aldolase, partial [Desulforhopalus sp.]